MFTTTLSIRCAQVCGSKAGLGQDWGVDSGLLGAGSWTLGCAASWRTHQWEADSEKCDWLVGFSAIRLAPFTLP